MKLRLVPSTSGQALDLRQRWHDASLAEAWVRPGDWYTPEVDAVVAAFTEDLNPAPSLERLGQARCEMGVGLGETLDDLVCLFSVLDIQETQWAYIRATAEAWGETLYASLQCASEVDPESNLVTFEYLVVRLKEVYARAAYQGESVTDRYCLIVVDTATDALSHWQQMQAVFTRSAALHEVFTHGETMATQGPSSCAVILVDVNDGVPQMLADLRESLTRHLSELGDLAKVRLPARVWSESLPADYHLARALVTGLAR